MLTRREVGQGLLAAGAMGAVGNAASAQTLFPGEEMIEAAGFPSLIRFIKGQSDKPLVVFVPGTSFLARIAYGFPGGSDDDFLATWVVREGFSFLATSYPLGNQVYQRNYPAFSITDWGRQIAAAARRVVDANQLGRRIIVIGWSMGGKPAVTVARAAKAAGLELALFIALDALPPGPNLFPGNAEALRLGPTGLVDQVKTLMPWFAQMLDAQNKINGHIIIPTHVLATALTGDPPLDIQGENSQYRNGRIVTDVASAAADSGATDYGAYPPMALIVSDSAADYPNVLLCRSNWGLLIGQQLYRQFIFPQRTRMAGLPAQQWQALQRIITTATERLTIQISGTHFLFVGADGAQKAAQAVTELLARSEQVQRDIAAALG
jgi:hypothetical protein